jgi:hypothetical protein
MVVVGIVLCTRNHVFISIGLEDMKDLHTQHSVHSLFPTVVLIVHTLSQLTLTRLLRINRLLCCYLPQHSTRTNCSYPKMISRLAFQSAATKAARTRAQTGVQAMTRRNMAGGGG